MKIIFKITTIAILLFSVTTSSIAQKNIKEGSVIFELTTIESDSPDAQMMKGSRMNISFNKKNQKLEMSFMGGMMEIATITNNDTEESTMLTNIMGKKAMVKMSKEESDKQKAKNVKPEFEISFDKNDKKEILGYKCYKALLKSKDGSAISTYVTDEIKTSKLDFFNEMLPGLDAFPLEYSIENTGMVMIFSAQEFNTKVSSDVFEIPAEGYTEMTMEEFEKEMGGLGGMGF